SFCGSTGHRFAISGGGIGFLIPFFLPKAVQDGCLALCLLRRSLCRGCLRRLFAGGGSRFRRGKMQTLIFLGGSGFFTTAQLLLLAALADPAHHLMDTALPKNLGLVRALHRAVFPLNAVNFCVNITSHCAGGGRSRFAANAHAGTANHPVFLIVEG